MGCCGNLECVDLISGGDRTPESTATAMSPAASRGGYDAHHTLCWRKSSRSGDKRLSQVARTADRVLVRDSENPSVVLDLSLYAWCCFVDGVGKGDFDLE